MVFVKQSTAVTLLIGPFVDEDDGKTAETGLTISQADVRLSKNGGNMAQKNNADACVHDELGYYTCALDTTDTNTLGVLKVMVHESGALPVWETCMVVTANVWDTLCSTDQLDVNVTNVAGTSQTANDNGADINAILTDTGTTLPSTLSTIDGKVDTIDGNVDSILTDTGTTLPATLTTIDGIVDDILVDTGTTLPSTLSTIEGKVDTVDGNVDSILTDTGTTLPATLATIDGIVDDILVDTGTTLDSKIDVIDANVDSILTDTGTTLDGKIDTIDGIVDSILVDTAEIGAAGAGLTAVPWNASWDNEVQSEVADALTAYGAAKGVIKNAAFSNFCFPMVDSNDDLLTGLTVTATVSQDGGAFGAISGSVAEIANGIYQLDAAAADMNADTVIFRFTASGAEDSFAFFKTS